MDDYDFSDYDFGGYEDYTDYYAPQDTVDQILNYEPSGDQATDIVYPDVYYEQGGEMPADQQVYPDMYYQQDFGPSDQMSQEEINQILTGTGGSDKYSFKADYGAPTQDKLGLKATLDETAPGYAIEAKTPYGVDEETGTGMQMPTAPNLTSMGGGQGLTLDIPAEYDSQGNLIPGTGGVLSEKGFVPGNAQRVLGDPRSYINNPTVTGRTQVTTDSIKKPFTPPNVNDVKKFIQEATGSKGGVGGSGGGGSGTAKGGGGLDLMKLLPLLLAMMAANKQQAPATSIPSLGASRSQLPYSPPRPGQPNVSYFTPVTYRASGGIVSLAEGGETTQQSDPMADIRKIVEDSVRKDYAHILDPKENGYDPALNLTQADLQKRYDDVVKSMTDYQMKQRIGRFINPQTLAMTPDLIAETNQLAKMMGANSSQMPGLLESAFSAYANDVNRYGAPEAKRNYYVQQQNQLGNIGEDPMANSQYAALQQKINELAPVASQENWQSRVNAIQPYGTPANAVYRDPKTGAGVAVYANPDNDNLVSSLRYFDRYGKNVDTSIFNAPELYEAAEKYGIDLSKVGTLGSQLQKQNLGYLPGQLYPTTVNSETGIPETSNHGINFADIAKNKMGTAYDWTQDPNAASKGPTAIDYVKKTSALANRLGINPLSTRPYASGGIAGLNESNLGGYSDGGRLLKGPGDGVSDSIPATIGGKQPARLADGEFVVPARIVSELGNGSTDAGARKLYDMMKRVEQTRKKGKHIAQDTKADKHLPA